MKKIYRFQFSVNGEKDFSSLEKALQSRIANKLQFFEEAENTMFYAKKLNIIGDRYSFRIGDYRVIVTSEDQDILVILLILKIGHRKEVYSLGL